MRLTIVILLVSICYAADMTPWNGWKIKGIEHKQYGDNWPIIFEKGMLGCKASAVVFRATPSTEESKRTGMGHQEYPVNGIARGQRLAGAPGRDFFTIVKDVETGRLKMKHQGLDRII